MCQHTNINHGILIGSAFVSEDNTFDPVLDLKNRYMSLHEDTCLCHIEPIEGELANSINEKWNFISYKNREKLDKIDINPEYLTEEQIILVKNLIEECAEIFASENPGTTNFVELTIDVGNHAPINQPLYRCSGATRQIIEEQVVKMLEQKFIRQSRSSWASPIVLVKKDGTTRFFNDYRNLNKITVRDVYPLYWWFISLVMWNVLDFFAHNAINRFPLSKNISQRHYGQENKPGL